MSNAVLNGLKIKAAARRGEDMTDSLGAWSNAPLVYALAEVRTERLADIKNYQAKFAGRLRDDGYPIQRILQASRLVASTVRVIVEPEHDATVWEFATPDNKTAVMLRANGLVLHATHYIDSKTFLSRLEKVIAVFSEEIPSVYVRRAGLRYIDFVLPRKGETPEKYVDERLNPDLKLASQPGGITATNLAIYQMEGGRRLTIRYTRGRGKPEMPPDLGTLALDPSPLMKAPTVKEDQPTGILDFDCNITYSPVARLDTNRLKQDFDAIYEDSFTAFKAAITSHARRVWGEKK